MCVCLNDWLAYTAVLRVKGQTAPSYVTTKQRWIATEADTGSNKADSKEPLPHRVLAGGFEVRITGVLPVSLHCSLSPEWAPLTVQRRWTQADALRDHSIKHGRF